MSRRDWSGGGARPVRPLTPSLGCVLGTVGGLQGFHYTVGCQGDLYLEKNTIFSMANGFEKWPGEQRGGC